MVTNLNLQFSELLISEDSTVRKALSIIDQLCVESVFVVKPGGLLVGVVTEEDIRKALLGGSDLTDTVRTIMRKPRAQVGATESRAEVLDLMHALKLHEVPVLDPRGRVTGIHVDDAVIGPRPCENWAVIMAGGKGTRLGPLTKNMPKPMLPVAGRPILERLVLHLVGSGIERIFLSVNYLADIIEKHFGDGSKFGCSIEYLREETDTPLGTGGPLRLLEDLGYTPQAPILVMNGDLITSFSVDSFLEAHRQLRAAATIAVSEYEHQVPFGVLESAGGQLVRIVEKPTRSWAVNAGIYVIEPRLLSRIPRAELFPITKLFDQCLVAGDKVGLWSLQEDWQDIGRPAELAQARGQV
ncbi:nucleotidyltransferase family protein [Amycolatopsis sp.]|uniref:nucleotidyltransferase family protein n=1 Tax=Amycolatopsis sp. TaxID=37632 RepID=UPI002BEBFF03|nr:nucleotidyltransferase family protein [Amycolatopsis sp.]HVV11200.1 nucleotidyltransferase family protein [Amycolatopsis sp.]